MASENEAELKEEALYPLSRGSPEKETSEFRVNSAAPCQFLTKDDTSVTVAEIGDEPAQRKVGQALREGAPQFKEGSTMSTARRSLLASSFVREVTPNDQESNTKTELKTLASTKFSRGTSIPKEISPSFLHQMELPTVENTIGQISKVTLNDDLFVEQIANDIEPDRLDRCTSDMRYSVSSFRCSFSVDASLVRGMSISSNFFDDDDNKLRREAYANSFRRSSYGNLARSRRRSSNFPSTRASLMSISSVDMLQSSMMQSVDDLSITSSFSFTNHAL